MVRLALALVAAASATACHGYSSGPAAADILLIAVHSTAEVAEDDDCDLPRTTFHPKAGASPGTMPAARLTGVAVVYRRDPPRRPYSIAGTMRTRVSDGSCISPDLIEEIRDQAAVHGCDAVVVGDEMRTADGGAALDGSCLVFSR